MENHRHGRKCVVPGCTDLFSKKHSFPKNDVVLFEKWINKVQNPILNNKSYEQIFKSHLVCDLHFSEYDRMPGSRRGLRKLAVPTKFLPSSEPKEYITESLSDNSTKQPSTSEFPESSASSTSTPKIKQEPEDFEDEVNFDYADGQEVKIEFIKCESYFMEDDDPNI